MIEFELRAGVPHVRRYEAMAAARAGPQRFGLVYVRHTTPRLSGICPDYKEKSLPLHQELKLDLNAVD